MVDELAQVRVAGGNLAVCVFFAGRLPLALGLRLGIQLAHRVGESAQRRLVRVERGQIAEEAAEPSREEEGAGRDLDAPRSGDVTRPAADGLHRSAERDPDPLRVHEQQSHADYGSEGERYETGLRRQQSRDIDNSRSEPVDGNGPDNDVHL